MHVQRQQRERAPPSVQNGPDRASPPRLPPVCAPHLLTSGAFQTLRSSPDFQSCQSPATSPVNPAPTGPDLLQEMTDITHSALLWRTVGEFLQASNQWHRSPFSGRGKETVPHAVIVRVSPAARTPFRDPCQPFPDAASVIVLPVPVFFRSASGLCPVRRGLCRPDGLGQICLAA